MVSPSRIPVFRTIHPAPQLLIAQLSSRDAQTLTGGADSITVKWSGFGNAADSMSIKLCFHKDKTVDRPWRKYNDNINKNKQCWQTAKLKKFLKEGIDYVAAGTETIELPMNTAPSTYSVQVLSKKDGTYEQWGDSKEYTQTSDPKCAHVTVACPTCAWPPPPAPPPALPPPPLADDDHAAGLAGLLVLLATTTINMLFTL